MLTDPKQAQEKLRRAVSQLSQTWWTEGEVAELDRILGYSELLRQLDFANQPDPRLSALVQQRDELVEALRIAHDFMLGRPAGIHYDGTTLHEKVSSALRRVKEGHHAD